MWLFRADSKVITIMWCLIIAFTPEAEGILDPRSHSLHISGQQDSAILKKKKKKKETLELTLIAKTQYE